MHDDHAGTQLSSLYHSMLLNSLLEFPTRDVFDAELKR